MTIDSENVQYGCRKRITNPELIEFLREYANNPFTLSPQEVVYNAYKRIGMELDIDDIFADYESFLSFTFLHYRHRFLIKIIEN